MKGLSDHPALSRGLALAILLALAGVVYFGMVDPLLARYRLDRRDIEDLQSAYMRFERIAGERASHQGTLAALERQRSEHEGFLRGTNETLMAAGIQNRIKALVVAAQGELASTQILPSENDGKLKRIGVREQLSIPMIGLAAMVHHLEGTAPYLFLDNVGIRVHPEGGRRAAAAAAPSSMVEVRFDAYGFLTEAP